MGFDARAVSTGTHLDSSRPLRHRLEQEFGDTRFEDLPVRYGEHFLDGDLVNSMRTKGIPMRGR